MILRNMAVCSALLVLLTGCVTPLKQVRLDRLDEWIVMSKGPCYGLCPVYTLTVYQNGITTFQGEEHTEKEGLHVKRLNESTMNSLRESLSGMDIWKFKDAYPGRFPDLPSVRITFYRPNGRKTVVGKDGRPPEIMALEEKLERIAFSENWTSRSFDDDQDAYGQLLVQLNPEVDVHNWITAYADYELKIVEALAAPGNFWQLSFNEEKIRPRELVALLRSDGRVFSAELN
ncbi:MAG: DUF6438 domain-containing protein [Saprospiraceae bacterium]|nr:DUF6438 domain-containing protein [Saprospiraceae bacterium]